jgi:FkbM family methyltransferase
MKTLLKKILNRLGYRLEKIVTISAPPEEGTMETCLQQLKAAGFQPGLVYDIGANRGDWTRTARTVFSESSFLLVEPQPHLRPHLADLLEHRTVTLVQCAASDHAGKAAFFTSEWDVTSHLASGTGGEPQNGTTFEVEVKTVDQLIAENGGRIPDFIKIDAEGFDLKVLAGAISSFGKTEAFLIEASLCCPGLENDVFAVVRHMHEKGYKLAMITEINPYQSPPDSYAPGLQWLADLLFLRADGPLLKKLQYPDSGTLLKKW